MFETVRRLSSDTQNGIITHLQDNISPHLLPDKSTYAKDRERVWLQHEAPLYIPGGDIFKPGLIDNKLWSYCLKAANEVGMTYQPQCGLVIYGDIGIEPHRDATSLMADAVQINLGPVEFRYDINRNTNLKRGDKPNWEYHAMDGGEVTRMDVKHLHAAVDPSDTRFSILLWRINSNNKSVNAELNKYFTEHPKMKQYYTG